jgi:osmotically-inducible protein OsmY
MKFFRVLLLGLWLSAGAVAAGPPSDDEIYDKVRITLTNDADVKGGAIEVKVSKGVVELHGSVRLEKQRLKAEKLAKKVKGVQKVVNNLKVTPI